LEFLALGRGQPVRTPALVPLSLCHPVADRLRSRLELPLYLLGRATSTHEINHLPPKLRRGWCSLPSLAPHRGLLRHKSSGVHQTGSTSIRGLLSDAGDVRQRNNKRSATQARTASCWR